MKKVVNRKVLASLVLMTAMFLNPFGYDILFYGILKLTGDSYVLTTSIFYLLSLSALGGYFLLSNKWFLALAMFFNPLGFDIVFYMIYQGTDSYILTTLILYIATISLLLVYFKLAFIKPKYWVVERVKAIKKFVAA